MGEGIGMDAVDGTVVGVDTAADTALGPHAAGEQVVVVDVDDRDFGMTAGAAAAAADARRPTTMVARFDRRRRWVG